MGTDLLYAYFFFVIFILIFDLCYIEGGISAKFPYAI